MRFQQVFPKEEGEPSRDEPQAGFGSASEAWIFTIRGVTNVLAGAAAAVTLLHATCAFAATAKTPQTQPLPALREQAKIVDAWTEERKALIPGILRKYGIDAWLISQREYAEDTVFWALKEATMFSARRRTTQLFLANSSDGAPSSYSWIENTGLVWRELNAILNSQQPRSIALNTHSELAFSGGLHAGERDAITTALGPAWADKFVLEPMLGVELVATMVEGRLPQYEKMMETAWAIIEEAFSSRIIIPGETTAWDVEWWMRERIQELNYTTWFHPSVFILTEDDLPAMPGEAKTLDNPRAPDHLIHYGDVLQLTCLCHFDTDFGVSAMGLNTDTQHLGYVMNPGESEDAIPEGFLEGLKKGNRLQDITRENMKIGMTGNDILKAVLAQAHSEGIEGKIYCHPTGEFGHSAGTVIGMTNLQDKVPVLGDLPLLKNTYYSIELFAEHFVPERNQTIRFPLEEDVYWNEEAGTWDWVYGQQTSFIFIHPPAKEGADAPAEL
ncbi:hypothetical protein BJ170DRAFT_593991 [Xylariales sp. AK1849]|nr:hypothetical protein BJ170DRAFT_593991 [Xylariales sp. AK1849]